MADIDEQQTEETEEPVGRSAAELLEAASDDELLAHPAIAAQIEARVSQRAEEQRKADAERRRVEDEQANKQRLVRLRRENPFEYAQEMDRLETQREARDAERERAQAEIYAEIEELDLDPAAKKLLEKSWTGDTIDDAKRQARRDIKAAVREDERLKALKPQEAASGAGRSRGGKDFADEESMAAAWQNGQIDDAAMRAWYATHSVLRRR